MLARLKWRGAVASFFAAAAVAMLLTPAKAQAPSGQPVTIGFSMALTGPLAANGKQALLGMKIWEEEINAKGGLLGRPVKLVYYDDQSNPSTVPGIWAWMTQRTSGRSTPIPKALVATMTTRARSRKCRCAFSRSSAPKPA